MLPRETHDCEKEYWQHCLKCVSGDPDAEIAEVFTDSCGICTEARIDYGDGHIVELVRGPNGWDFKR